MEEVYIKNVTREWCTDETDVKAYFKRYSEALSFVNDCYSKHSKSKDTSLNILKKMYKDANRLSNKDIKKLKDKTNPKGFLSNNLSSSKTSFDDEKPSTSKVDTDATTAIPQPSCSKNGPQPSGSKDGNSKGLEDSPDRGSLIAKNRLLCLYKKPRSDVLVMDNTSGAYSNIVPNKEYVVHFRIHEPFDHKSLTQKRTGRCSHEICILSSQRLSELRDKIICENDYQDGEGESSENLVSNIVLHTKEVYKSSMFYFGNTFYIDTRDPEMKDYSKGLREWFSGRMVELGETKSMSRTLISDLKLRFGYPYLFKHQGNCEHLVIPSDARLVSHGDCRTVDEYPLFVRITHKNILYCVICNQKPVKWIVYQCERMLYDANYMCQSCHTRFNYVDGKKVDNFKAFKYTQRGFVF